MSLPRATSRHQSDSIMASDQQGPAQISPLSTNTRWSVLKAQKCLRKSKSLQCQIKTPVMHKESIFGSNIDTTTTDHLLSPNIMSRLYGRPSDIISCVDHQTSPATTTSPTTSNRMQQRPRASCKLSPTPTSTSLIYKLPMYLLILLAISTLNQLNLIRLADGAMSDPSAVGLTNETSSAIQQALSSSNSSDTFSSQALNGKDKPSTPTSGNSNNILNINTSSSQRSSAPTSQNNLLNRTPMFKLAPFHHLGSQQRENIVYKTTYACEGNQMDLACQEGKLIHLVRANYGRFSLSICNDLGHSNYSVNCASFRAFLFMENRCNKLSNCSVTVSKELFGDPCEGTSKYLEVQYYCSDANQARQSGGIPSSSGHQLQPTGHHYNASQRGAPSASVGQPAVGHKSPVSSAPTVSQTANQSGVGGPQADMGPGHANSQPPVASPDANQLLDLAIAPSSSPVPPPQGQPDFVGAPVIQQQQQQYFCPAQASWRNLFWNSTRPGHLARQPCPEGSSGSVSWLCAEHSSPDRAGQARFLPLIGPDFSQCKSNWLARLSQQLEQMLESSSPAAGHLQQVRPIELARQQDEQLFGSILGELALMARTRELFSEDLRRIDWMLGQMIGHLKALSASPQQPASEQANWSPVGRFARTSAHPGPASGALGPMWERLFVKLAGILSSLFEPGQRSAWLEIGQPEARRRLELRLMNHVRELGQLMAGSMSAEQLAELQPVRLANVFAGLSVIGPQTGPPLRHATHPDGTTNELNLAQPYPMGDNTNLDQQQQFAADQGAAEFRLQIGLVNELPANGIGKLLIIDIKKPDYGLMRQQLEQQAASNWNANANANTNTNNNLQLLEQAGAGDQVTQLQARIFGLFAIAADHSSSGSEQATWMHQQDALVAPRLNELLAQWPIIVDFRLGSSSPLAASTSGAEPSRQCQSLNDLSLINHQQAAGQASYGDNRCKLVKFNATNYVCACDKFGFVALTSAAPKYLLDQHQQQFPWLDSTLALGDASNQLIGAQQPGYNRALDYIQSGANLRSASSSGLSSGLVLASALGLLVLLVGAFVINATLRASATHSRLGKKQQSFLESLGRQPSATATATTTTSGSMPDHQHHQSLLGNLDPLISGNHQCVGATQSASSIIGLATGQQQQQHTNPNHHLHTTGALITSCANNGSTYKTHQQLYGITNSSTLGYSTNSLAPHANQARLVPRFVNWLARVPRWLATTVSLSPSEANGNKADHMIHHPHHQIIATANGQHTNSSSSTTVGRLAAYKCHQNGYTTSLGMYHPHLAQQQLQQQQQQQQQQQLRSTNGQTNNHHQQQQINSSSNSSYVSSSAYYEEIGPGNLTKINSAQSHHTTIVDPFKRPQVAETYQWAKGPSNAEQRIGGPATNFMSTGGLVPTSQAMQTLNSRQASSQHHHNNVIHHNDLSPLQSSSSSSAGSQHSAATSMTTANGSTPRHYLFASPSAVSAYKQQFRQ